MPRQPQISALRNPGLLFGRPLYVLEGAWAFEVAGYGRYVIPAGYRFDGASVPQILWGFPFGYTPFGVHIGAAIEHDFLCDLGLQRPTFINWLGAQKMPMPKPVPSPVAHAHFHQRLREDGLADPLDPADGKGMRPGQVWAMGTAVKLFGPRWKT